MKITQTSQFKKDAKRQQKRGKDLDKLFDVIDLLTSAKDLPANLRDHTLTGNWKGWRDCHIEPDVILSIVQVGGILGFPRKVCSR